MKPKLAVYRPRTLGGLVSTLVAALVLSWCSPLAYSQKTPQSAEQEAESKAERQAMETSRQEFDQFLAQHPDVFADVYGDPALFSDQNYLSQHPQFAAFLASHPLVRKLPSVFLGPLPGQAESSGFRPRGDRQQRTVTDAVVRLMDEAGPFLIFAFLLLAVLWVFRVLINHRRWRQIARVQAEAHAKLLDKFAANQELLAYLSSEPGKRFLESAPIEFETNGLQTRRTPFPFGRILWSIQLGLIMGLVGGAFLYSRGWAPDAVEGLSILGALCLAVGIGFVLSAGVSYVLAKRLGLLETFAPASPAGPTGSLTLNR